MIIRAREEWERAFAVLPDTVAVIDNQYRILRVNEAMARRTGIKAEECIGLHCYEVVHGLSKPPESCPHSRAIKDGRPHIEEVHEERWGGDFIISATPITDEQGVMIGVVHVAHDITERKKMEEALRSSQETTEAILNASNESIFLVDNTGVVLSVNEACARRLHAEPSEMINRSIFDFLPADAAQTRKAVGEEVLRTGKPVQFEDERDGMFFDIRVYPLRDEAGRITRFVVYASDITERKGMEEELRRSREELEVRVRERTAELMRALESFKTEVAIRKRSEAVLSEARDLADALSSTSDLQAALVLCLDTALRVGNMTFGGIYLVNQDWGHLHLAAHRGIPDEFLPGVMDYDNTTPNFRLVAAGRPVYAPWRDLGLLPAGLPDVMRGVAIVPICNEGKPVACLNLASGIVDDIPEATRTAIETVAAHVGAALVRIQAEEERKRLATVVEHSQEGMIIVDKSFRIEYVNPAFARMTGYSQKELAGKDARLLQAEMMDCSRYEASREQVKTKGTVLVRSAARTKAGTAIPVESVLSSLGTATGNFEGYILRCRDITEQVRLEEQLRQSQKMESVGTLAGGIAHDFNNILAIILGNAELAQDDDDYRSIRRNIAHIVNASKRARELVRQILTFSRKNERNRVNLRLIPLVEETYRLLRASTPSTIAMNLRITTDADIVFADATEIQQVLMNLITNAAHSMRENGGRLTITLSDAAFSPSGPFPESDMPHGEYMKITVADTGTGMAAEVRKRIFDPFFTTKEVGYGTGMGLAVVYGIVKSYEGAITVQSRPGKGSTFSIYLPKARIVEVSEAKEEGAVPGGTEHILVVDDEEPIAVITRLTLERLGYKVTAATDPAEAWKLFREQEYDLVITDQTMPGISGLALAQKMLKARKGIPIILCTGFSETATPEKARASGIVAYVMKPVDKLELAKTVRRVLDGKGNSSSIP